MSYSRNYVKNTIHDTVVNIREYDNLLRLGLVSFTYSEFIDNIYAILSPADRDDYQYIQKFARLCLFRTILDNAERRSTLGKS